MGLEGIVIWMYHDECTIVVGRTSTPATVTVKASIDIETLAVIADGLPPRARRLVTEWARAHPAELRANWERARDHRPLESIEPLR